MSTNKYQLTTIEQWNSIKILPAGHVLAMVWSRFTHKCCKVLRSGHSSWQSLLPSQKTHWHPTHVGYYVILKEQVWFCQSSKRGLMDIYLLQAIYVAKTLYPVLPGRMARGAFQVREPSLGTHKRKPNVTGTHFRYVSPLTLPSACPLKIHLIASASYRSGKSQQSTTARTMTK